MRRRPNTKKRPLYGLIDGIPSQKAIIDKACFGTCGKIILGGINGGNSIGPMVPCRQPADKCPQFDREMDEPIGYVMGDPLFIRKLKP